jgi:hypothetical protein
MPPSSPAIASQEIISCSTPDYKEVGLVLEGGVEPPCRVTGGRF